MARGFEDKLAMDMSKFFDTNYHYLVRLNPCLRALISCIVLLSACPGRFAWNTVVLRLGIQLSALATSLLFVFASPPH